MDKQKTTTNEQRRFRDFSVQRSKIVPKGSISINHAAQICLSILFYFFSASDNVSARHIIRLTGIV